MLEAHYHFTFSSAVSSLYEVRIITFLTRQSLLRVAIGKRSFDGRYGVAG